MKKAKRRVLALCIATSLFLLTLFLPGLPWSARYRHILKRVMTKAEMRVSAWQGVQPKLIGLSGKILTSRQDKVVLRGAEVEALDSVSGWATLSDEEGIFFLPDVTWYPQARYTLVVTNNEYQAKQLSVLTPATYPAGGILNVGDLELASGCPMDLSGTQGRNSISLIEYDDANTDYYKNIFNKLIEGKETDEEKLEAIHRYVREKVIAESATDKLRSPRLIMENGSSYSGELALALATLAKVGNYNTRLIDLIDTAKPAYARMVTEVYYGDRWHLYDPVSGPVLRDQDGLVVSYKELRLSTSLLSEHLQKSAPVDAKGTSGIYRSGIHHYYYFAGE
jgi:hypothetical protein